MLTQSTVSVQKFYSTYLCKLDLDGLIPNQNNQINHLSPKSTVLSHNHCGGIKSIKSVLCDFK